MKRHDLDRAVEALALAFPETETHLAHGMAHFRVLKGKTFAMYARNHHGDGRIALWLPLPDGMQDALVREDPQQFFVPPYVGPSGWLGVRLDNGLAWKRVCSLVRSSYEHIAPARLARGLVATPSVPAPKRRIRAADIDPWNTPRGQRVLETIRKVCLTLPQTSEDKQFGSPVWRVGSKVFARAYAYEEGQHFQVWVGVLPQGMLTSDPRYTIPPYSGHLGWIALDVSRVARAPELRALARESWRHFAPKRLAAQV
jgi:hypothetical protein